MFYIIFDFIMAVIMLLFGIWFYKSDGNTAKFLSGYNIRTKEERKKYDENNMCMVYGPSWKVIEKVGFILSEKRMYKDLNDDEEKLYRFYENTK